MKSTFLNFLKFAGACLFLFTGSFFVGTKVFSAEPTRLHLDFEDAQGQAVRVDKATLVLVAGGYVDKLPLEVSSKGLDLPLGAYWLQTNWPGGVSRLKNMDRAYVYLAARGYASVVSNPIHWMGSESGGLDKNVVVSFPRSKIAAVSKGQKGSLTVPFRKPKERFVKLSDGKGNPIVGARVKAYVYWSKSDDGDLNGADFLNEGISDATGRVPIMDGDFTYAIRVVSKGSPGMPAENVLIVKRFEDREYPVTVP
jgi:hypothetical protein